MRCLNCFYALAVLLVISLALALPWPAALAGHSPRSWTFMLYMCADNDLGYFADQQDLAEIERATYSPDVAVVVLHDDVGDNGCVIYVSAPSPDGTIELKVAEELPEMNTGNYSVLAWFIEYGVTHYPAEHYALVLWDHGGGWLRLSTGQSSEYAASDPTAFRRLCELALGARGLPGLYRGVCFDWTNDDHLTTEELELALKTAYEETGVVIDVLGFDACLMQMLEVAYQVRDYARIMVASQEVEPAFGWAYEQLLDALASNPAMSPVELAKAAVDSYARFYEETYPWHYYTMSAVDLAKVGEVASRLDELAKVLIECGCALKIHKARMDTATFYEFIFADLYDFAEQLKGYVPDSGVAQLADALMKAIDDAVIYERHGSLAGSIRCRWSGIDVPAHEGAVHGISICHPYSAVVFIMRLAMIGVEEDYTALGLSRDTYWDEFILTLQPALEVTSMLGFTAIVEGYGLTPLCYPFELTAYWDGRAIPVVAQALGSIVTDWYGRARLILTAPSALETGEHEIRVVTEWMLWREVTRAESLPARFTVAEFALPEDVSTLNRSVNILNQTIQAVNQTIWSEIDRLGSEIEEVGSALAQVNRSLTAEIGEIRADLEAYVEMLKKSIDAVRSEVSAVKTWVSSEIDRLQAGLSKLNETLAVEISRLSAMVGELNVSLTSRLKRIGKSLEDLSARLDRSYKALSEGLRALSIRLDKETKGLWAAINSTAAELRDALDTLKKEFSRNMPILYGASSAGTILAIAAIAIALRRKS